MTEVISIGSFGSLIVIGLLMNSWNLLKPEVPSWKSIMECMNFWMGLEKEPKSRNIAIRSVKSEEPR